MVMKKRLEKMGHVVSMTTNGEECLHRFEEASTGYDAILMDMQVTIPFPPTLITADGKIV
jgi:CheY-like chemotaxis protein